MIALLVILGLIVLFLAVIFIRAAMFKPKDKPEVDNSEVSFDAEKATEALQSLIRCKTVSYQDHSLEDDAEFEKLIGLLPKLYPNVFEKCEFQRLPDRALLFKWTGKKHDAPSVMMAHYDVVPVDEENWAKPPFGGVIEDGVLWGRGALDTKVTFNGVLFSANTLIGQGFTPENDMYFAFSGGEEINGMGAVNIVNWFFDHKITPAIVVDEGGAVVDDIFPGVKESCGLIGIAEKGMINLEFSVESDGGHASAPGPHTPVGELSAACAAMENNPFKMHVTDPAGYMFDTLGRHSTFVFRVIFSNMWLFKGILNGMCKKKGGELNALLRTTVAFTQASGSKAPNVIPPQASMVANLRLNPDDSVQGAVDYVKKTIKNDNVKLSLGNHMEPSPVSEVGGEAWKKIEKAVASTWKGCIVSPYLMVQCSDSRHYRDLSNHVYRFSAMDMTAEERHTIHGNNERIRLEALKKSIEFYIRLMKQC